MFEDLLQQRHPNIVDAVSNFILLSAMQYVSSYLYCGLSLRRALTNTYII